MKLFIANLPHAFSDEDLKSLFSEYSPISCKVIFDRDTNRSKGFGFVELESKESGQEAIDSLNGREVDGRAIVVKEAHPQEKRPRRDSRPSFRKERRSY